MVASHRSKSSEVSYSQTDELITRSEQVQRSPSARERFAKNVAGSSTTGSSSSSSRRGTNSYASRLIKANSSRTAGKAASVSSSVSVSLAAADSPAKSPDAAAAGAADHAASWQAGIGNHVGSSCSTFNGAAGSVSLDLQTGPHTPGCWGFFGRRSASEGLSYPR